MAAKVEITKFYPRWIDVVSEGVLTGRRVLASIGFRVDRAVQVATYKKVEVWASTIGFDDSSAGIFDVTSSFSDIAPGAGIVYTISIGNVGTFNAKSNHYFTLRFAYGSDWAETAYGVVYGVESPLLISKNNLGVGIGGAAKGTYGNPKFECHWPSYFTGGIKSFGSPWYDMELAGDVLNSAGVRLRCRKVADKCAIDGRVYVKPGISTIVLAYLPEQGVGWMPRDDVFAIAPCEGTDNPRIARIVVAGMGTTNAGALCLSWVKNVKDGSSYTSDSIWVQCSIEYYV